MRGDAIYCPECGATRPSLATQSSPVVAVSLVVAGVVCAIPAWLGLSMLGAQLLNDVGHRSGEFVPSWGTLGYFVALTMFAVAGLILQARFRMNLALRAFTLAFLITTLGLFALCDLFGASSQG